MTSLRNQAYTINWADDLANVDQVVDNLDVIVHFEDGSRYAATFFTLANIKLIQERYRETGECGGGLHFWASHMIVIESLTWSSVESAVSDMIKTGEFESAFEGPLSG